LNAESIIETVIKKNSQLMESHLYHKVKRPSRFISMVRLLLFADGSEMFTAKVI